MFADKGQHAQTEKKLILPDVHDRDSSQGSREVVRVKRNNFERQSLTGTPSFKSQQKPIINNKIKLQQKTSVSKFEPAAP